MRVADQEIETIGLQSPVVEGLTVVDLRKSYLTAQGARLEVLSGLNLNVKPGEAVAIMGASGSGKSTLLHLLGGLDEVDHGMIDLDGAELGKLKGHLLDSFRQKHVGFVFQFHYLLQDLSAIENVMLPLLISRRRRVVAGKLALEMLHKFGLADRIDSPVGQLSGGEQQRVAVARALITGPKMLLADEPTGNLDSSIGSEIADLMVEYAHRNSAIVIVATHNEDLSKVCDRSLVLKEGRLHPL
ncbi:MAG TPA: ABC transporter ATP-binding protein [Pyrinomonadaceae bacterium]|nr:ABC transporter ATP-binding protein [Pyrinomonadaceae bacterium]